MFKKKEFIVNKHEFNKSIYHHAITKPEEYFFQIKQLHEILAKWINIEKSYGDDNINILLFIKHYDFTTLTIKHYAEFHSKLMNYDDNSVKFAYRVRALVVRIVSQLGSDFYHKYKNNILYTLFELLPQNEEGYTLRELIYEDPYYWVFFAIQENLDLDPSLIKRSE